MFYFRSLGAMSNPIPEFDLLFALSDAMRAVKLPSMRRTLSEGERAVLARAISDRLKLSRWEVVCNPDRGNIHASIAAARNVVGDTID